MTKVKLNTKNNVVIIIVLLLALILWGCKSFLYFRETVILGLDTKDVAIYIEPDDPATRASAIYLSYALAQSFEKEVHIVTEKDENVRYLSILCETDADPDDEAPAYTVTLDHGDVVIRIPQHSRCFGVVKAVTDRWLQEDCGQKKSEELRISQAIVERELSFLSTAVTGEVRILTQNLRYTDDPNGNSVQERSERFVRLVEEYRPDLIGTQECTLEWLQLLQDALSDSYEFYGCSRLGPDSDTGEWNAVLYRKDRFVFQDGENFWLSNTPTEAASRLNYDGPVRICTTALLQDLKTEKTLLFSNTHLQQGNEEVFREARSRQAEILLRRLRKGANRLAQYPGFLTGDFNAEAVDPFYSMITEYYEDSRNTAIADSSDVDYTFHAYGSTKLLIDYCFHSPKNVTVLDYRILDDMYNGYVSDHYGILVTAVVN